MRPFRSRVMAAIVFAILVLGLLGTAARAADIPDPNAFPEDPWDGPSAPPSAFPEDPWPGLIP
jgi:hypothetical protein